jgi:ATP-binding cassette subfamily B protein
MADSPISTRRAVGYLLAHLRRHTLALACGFVVLVGVDLAQLLIPHIIQQVLDRLSNAAYDNAFILKSCLIILAMATGMAVFRFFWRFLIVKPSRRIEERMRNDLFRHIELLSSPFYNRTKTGDLMALFVNDLGAIRMATSMALIGLFDAIFMSIMSLAFMIAISPRLTLFTALPLPLIILVLIRTGRIIESRYTLVQESFSRISTHTQESFSGIRVIKGFAREESEQTRFRVACDEYVDHNLALTKVWGLIFPTITFLASFSFSLLLLFGGRLVLAQGLSIGQFVSFTFYINLLVWPMIATGWVFNLLQRGIASTKRILEILDTRSEVVSVPDGEGAPPAGRIEFRDLTFRYAATHRAALAEVSLVIPEGSSLGIIGKPGSGKTTLASLLFHLYPLEKNRLFIDGRDINTLPLNALRQAIAYVPQDSFLFSDSIAANIAFGMDDGAPHRQEAIEEAARLAAVHRDIENFADGYETRIGERGVMLSGGQKQRLAIARALLTTSASILILDDALSAVDTATEAEILANIRPIIRRKTTLMIAHRISTIRQCDTIVVLDNGRIAERGTHDELAAAGGFYATLFELQRMRGEAA